MEPVSSNILLSNLIKIRWIAISGQLFAIFLVYFYFNISIPIIPCLCIVFVYSDILVPKPPASKITFMFILSKFFLRKFLLSNQSFFQKSFIFFYLINRSFIYFFWFYIIIFIPIYSHFNCFAKT